MPSRSEQPLREFELVVLLAVLELGEEAYPLVIRDAIASKTERRVSRAAVFITLERLEDKGFLSSRYGAPTPVRGGRAKRFFRAQARAIDAVKQAHETASAMKDRLEAVLSTSTKT